MERPTSTKIEAHPMSTHIVPKGTRGPKPGETVYERYIRTEELLRLQKPEDERLHPDELTFQVVHQTFELWWKVTAQQLGIAGDWLKSDHPAEAAHALRRAVAQQELVRQVMRQLETVSPAAFLDIRTGLGNGSGMDSPGFRAILRAAPAVWKAFAEALARAGLTLQEVYEQQARHFLWHECAEALVDFDEQFHLFRSAHLKLAERNLGMHAVGTGGTEMSALEQTLRDLLFPELWQVRDQLLARWLEEQAHPNGGGPRTAGGH
jgi:tryptophan 2,3-dioxygenase